MNFFERVKLQVKRNKTTIETLMNNVLGKKYSVDIYNGWRRRNCIPRADVCLQMADMLNVSIRYLLTGDESEDDSLRSQFLRYKPFNDKLDTLPPEDFKTVEKFVDVLATQVEKTE